MVITDIKLKAFFNSFIIREHETHTKRKPKCIRECQAERRRIGYTSEEIKK